MKRWLFQPPTSPTITEIYFGEDLFPSYFLGVLSKMEGKLVIVTDSLIKDLYGTSLAEKISAHLIVIESGEKVKRLEMVNFITNKLLDFGAGKDTILIALGGGVISDVVGLTASIFMRGISLVLIPTTLLGCVDAAIGGKNGIDTPIAKNVLGTIYHPKAIFISLNLLKTLKLQEWQNGFFEILKIGLTYNKSIWDLSLLSKEDPSLIWKAIEAKMEVVRQDPNERGLRRILNFGHTIGHALEMVSDFEMAHGEAVAIGCVVESFLSHHLGYLPKKAFDEIEQAYGSFLLKLPKRYSRETCVNALKYDKKNSLGKIRFVLIDQIGKSISFDGNYCRPISHLELAPSLDWMEARFS